MPVHSGQLHLNAPLSDFATAYRNDGFIADALSPIVLVDHRSDDYFTRSRRDVSVTVDDLVGPKGSANEADYDVGSASYQVKGRALKAHVDLADEANADAPLDPDEMAVSNVMQKLMLNRERRIATLLGTSGNYASGNTSAAGTVWSDETSSTPIGDINGAIAAIPFSGDDLMLKAWMTRPVWNALRKHPDILALKGLDKGQVSRAEFASFFELDEVLVSDLWYDSANPGQNASYARGWTATVFGVARVPRVVSGRDISALSVTFRTRPGMVVRTWDSPDRGERGARTHQVSFADAEVVVQNDMGYLLTSVL